MNPYHEEIITAIRLYQKTHPAPSPSVRELCQMTGIKSTSQVWKLLLEMADEGLIRLPNGKARSIELLSDK